MTTMCAERDSFEVVKGVFRFFEGEDFCSKMQTLHEAFHKLKQTKEFEALLDNMFFDVNRSFPYSQDLQQDLLNLEQAGLLSTTNPTFTFTQIKQPLRVTFDLYQKSLFSEGELSLLGEMAKQLKALLPAA